MRFGNGGEVVVIIEGRGMRGLAGGCAARVGQRVVGDTVGAPELFEGVALGTSGEEVELLVEWNAGALPPVGGEEGVGSFALGEAAKAGVHADVGGWSRIASAQAGELKAPAVGSLGGSEEEAFAGETVA
jgi:hypothetical protein